MAKFGKALNARESWIRNYLIAFDAMEEAMKASKDYTPLLLPGEKQSGPTNVEFRKIYDNFKAAEEKISLMFLCAVNAHDSKAILEIASAVWTFRDWPNPAKESDHVRATILFLKHISEESGEPMTIREIAKLTGVKDASDDGYSALRRKCKELGLAIAPSRKISPKKLKRALKKAA